MAINIKFDLFGNPEPPTIILANRNGKKLGQLRVNEDSIDLSDKFNDASELSFTVNKHIDGVPVFLWDKLVDFKLIYCKEWDLWMEAKVELDEETESVKTVFCTQLGQAELSQIMLHNIEINTETDISRDDYKISILWNETDPKASILDRTLEKAPHYSIVHVDDSIKNIQRSFSFDGTSIYDSHQEIAEEIGCLFVYHSDSDENGKIRRTISVYDLQQNCNGCGHRGEFTDECPKCGSKNIDYGFGTDTLIFVTADELASDGIQLTTDTDSVKNCFKLEAGDDLMTATIRNCNPNGTDYIWRFSDMVKDDMSQDLVDKIEAYDKTYNNYYKNQTSNINTTLLGKYNALVSKYSVYNSELQSISSPIKGYPNLMNAYYNAIDLGLYLKSGLMPSIEMSDTDAAKQAALLTNSALSPVAVNVDKISSVSLQTANSAVLSMAKIIVRSTYKVEINTSSISSDKKTWTGNFVITNHSDEEDTAISNTVNVTINNDNVMFIQQKINKALNKDNTEDYSITGLFAKELKVSTSNGKKSFSGAFYDELKKYALNPLKSFYDSCDACLNILIDQGAGNKNEKPDLYESLYKPYYDKSCAISEEIKLRESEVYVVEGVWDYTDEDNPKLKTKGMQQYIEECRNTIQDALNFEKYLGEDLWLEFCSYRREDTYSNSNYISDGLNNTELFEKALEFVEVAQNEIYKSSELQYSISTNLINLLAIDKFKSLVDSFELGNWIRVQVNDEVYKLRLIQYGINFGSFETIPVEFSDVTKIKNGVTDINSVLSQASSMASSYGYVQRQAKQGGDANGTVNNWLESGLNSALVRIRNNENEEVTLSRSGLLCRSYDDISEEYSPEQFRLTHNIMAYTTDNWETVSAALGKHNYKYYDSSKKLQDGIDYGLTAKFVTAGYINGSQIIGGEVYSQNYTPTTGTYMNLNDGSFSWAGGKIKYDGKNDVSLSGVNLTWSDIGDAPTKVSEFENDADYKNGIQVTQITKDTVTAPFIKTLNLSVGNEIKMGENASISWSQVTNKDSVATKTYVTNQGYQTASQVTQITKDTVTTSYVNALKVTANSVAAENITGTTISGKTISGGKISGAEINIGDGNFTVTSAGKMTTKSGEIAGNLSISGSLTHTRGDYTVTLRAVPTNTSYGVFFITDKSSGSNTYPFIVNGDGSFRATKATISGDSTFGGTLNAADGTFKGRLSAVSGSFTRLEAGTDKAKSVFTSSQVIINPSYIDSDGQEISKGSIYIGRSGVEGWEDITIRPSSDNLGNIGTSGNSWDVLYVKSGGIHSSDRNKKKDIIKMGEDQEKLFNLLSPVKFKFIDSSYDRFHYGFISQEVEDAIIESGLTTKDFAGFCKEVKRDNDGNIIMDKDGNPEYVYSLRYTEFIALNTHMIQKLQLENKILKERLDSLEKKIELLS